MEEEKIKVSRVHNILRGSESLLKTKEIFDEMGINFFLIHGTLLGVYRDGFLCPHEVPNCSIGDIDVASFDEMPDDKFDKFTEIVEKHGLKMFQISAKEGDGFRVVGAYIRGTHWYVGIEFWSRLSDKENVMTYDGLLKCPSKFFDSFKEIKYLGQIFNIPRDTEGFLEHNYGESWRTHCVQAIVDNKRAWVKCDLSGDIIKPVEVMDTISGFSKVSQYKSIE